MSHLAVAAAAGLARAPHHSRRGAGDFGIAASASGRLQQPCCRQWRRTEWRQAERRQRRGDLQLAPATYNPQNVEACQVPPSPEHSPEGAARIQLAALQRNDEPWPNHGVQTAYEWGLDIGGLDPSMYFGFPKDLYHFDHFLGMFLNRLGDLVNSRAFEICSADEQPGTDGAPPTSVVTFTVLPAVGEQRRRYEMQLRRKTVGARKGSWMVHMLRAVEEEA